MKRIIFQLLFLACLALLCLDAMSQSPYALSPQWRFGRRAGLSFPNGNYPNSGAPTTTPIAQNTGNDGVETSTSVCDKAGAIAIYSNTMNVYNNTNTSQRNLQTDVTCGGSATAGGIAFPDPASPGDTYYIFIANDLTSGSCMGAGINYYRFRKNGLGQAVYLSGPTLLTASGNVDESLTASTDGLGNYWVVSHSTTGASDIMVWKVTAGGVSALDRQATPDVVNGTANGSIKISPCQNKIAWAGNNNILVYNWNRTTGKIGTKIRQINGLDTWNYSPYLGIEFSPNGSYLYYVGLGGNTLFGPMKQVPLPTGAITQIDDANGAATMQIGPDGKIYTTNGDYGTTTNVGVINTPNNAAHGYNHTQISLPAGATMFRGISNIAWLTPETPVINNTITNCTVDFSHVFKNYFQANVGIDNTSFSWTFGDATSSTSVAPTHTYTSNNTFTVNLSFKDATCGHTWTASTSVTVSCPMPVDWMNINAAAKGKTVLVSWATAKEQNNDRFIIERSEDGINFTAIGQVAGVGNSGSVTVYEFIDEAPNRGLNYYRVVQYDYDQHSSTSEIVSASIHHTIFVEVVPNPSQDEFRLEIAGTSNAQVLVTDILGREVYSTLLVDENNLTFGNELAKGTYILKVVHEAEVFTKKLIKE